MPVQLELFPAEPVLGYCLYDFDKVCPYFEHTPLPCCSLNRSFICDVY